MILAFLSSFPLTPLHFIHYSHLMEGHVPTVTGGRAFFTVFFPLFSFPSSPVLQAVLQHTQTLHRSALRRALTKLNRRQTTLFELKDSIIVKILIRACVIGQCLKTTTTRAVDTTRKPEDAPCTTLPLLCCFFDREVERCTCLLSRHLFLSLRDGVSGFNRKPPFGRGPYFSFNKGH